jgi:putative transposase
VDKTAQIVDLLLKKQRDRDAALHFLIKAIGRNGMPETLTIEGSEVSASASRAYNEAHGTTIAIRQVRSRKTMVEQDHRAVKRLTRPRLSFTSVEAAQGTLAGIEMIPMIHIGQRAESAFHC